ncbi:hypothetical protein K1719_022968 [Acacia pycnantha]|nr:hypothetical protein K1719_022968 [Acacia pycnantha]
MVTVEEVEPSSFVIYSSESEPNSKPQFTTSLLKSTTKYNAAFDAAARTLWQLRPYSESQVAATFCGFLELTGNNAGKHHKSTNGLSRAQEVKLQEEQLFGDWMKVPPRGGRFRSKKISDTHTPNYENGGNRLPVDAERSDLLLSLLVDCVRFSSRAPCLSGALFSPHSRTPWLMKALVFPSPSCLESWKLCVHSSGPVVF